MALKLFVFAICVNLIRGFVNPIRLRSLENGVTVRAMPKGLARPGYVLQATSGGSEEDGPASKFVPVFVGVWAVGYTAITATQVFGYRLGPDGPSLASVGEFGGVASVVLTVGLFLALFVAAAVEVFKEDPQKRD